MKAKLRGGWKRAGGYCGRGSPPPGGASILRQKRLRVADPGFTPEWWQAGLHAIAVDRHPKPVLDRGEPRIARQPSEDGVVAQRHRRNRRHPERLPSGPLVEQPERGLG